MKKLVLAFAVVLAVAIPATASAALPGKRVGHASTAGQFATTSANATVKHPHALYGRAAGRGVTAFFTVGCSRGVNITSNMAEHNGAGLWKLPMLRGAESCDVIASVTGEGRVSLEIRAA